MKPHIISTMLTVTLSVSCLSSQAQNASPPSLKVEANICPDYALYDAQARRCRVDAGKVANMKDVERCKGAAQLQVTQSAQGVERCEVATVDEAGDTDGDPATFLPSCKEMPGQHVDRVMEGSEARCEYRALAPEASARSDYLGDCFLIKSEVPDLPRRVSRHWIVTGQDNTKVDDPTLMLVPASDWGHSLFQETAQRIMPLVGCTPRTSNVQPVSVSAHVLQEHGAIRRGFVYGLLTTPYKFYRSDKKFEAGVPVGPYLGWRIGQSGFGGALVAAFTLGSVNGETVQADPADASKTQVIGKTNLMALSGAVGIVFDVTRNPSKKGIKAGILIGKDWVNEDPGVRYVHNRKSWLAVQIGYDLTDY
jgi:hypothetical protein